LVVLVGCKAVFGLDDPRTRDGGSVGDSRIADAQPDAPPACTNGVRDNLESDIDCGPGCNPCITGKKCGAAGDCEVDSCIDSVCRLPRDCKELHQLEPAVPDGAYAIDTGGTSGNVTTFCDMTTDGGGWTLAGKVDGQPSMANVWLVSSQNVPDLTTTTIGTNSFACFDAVALAVNRASEVRLTNAARDRWVRWALPAGRTATTFWRHNAGQAVIDASATSGVTVTRSTGTTSGCNQNAFGINPLATHGGGYPYTSYNAAGNTQQGDACMTVGVTTTYVDGFAQNGNGYDAPDDETTWPNNAISQPVHVAVWLR